MKAPEENTPTIGPLLFLQGAMDDRISVVVLFVAPESATQPEVRLSSGVVQGAEVWKCEGRKVLRYAFDLPMAEDTSYSVDGQRYEVNAAFDRDIRIAFVSCNGQEHRDRRRDADERNVMWRRLRRRHAEDPFQLLLHGGDQIYADELVNAHPEVRSWSKGSRIGKSKTGVSESDGIVTALRAGFFERYLQVLSQPDIAWLMARVPSLAMWDDHDICDGWGSMPAAKLHAPVGRLLFKVAREHFLLFQLGVAPNDLPTVCPDRTGGSLAWHVRLPGFHLIAPDLRSERRPNRVIGERGWWALRKMLADVERGQVFVLSSVPALGPRLSWVEAILRLVPRMQKYEDDLRDQWQSRAHRAEWRTFLEELARVHSARDTSVTLLSGEIHLATHGTLDVPPSPLRQLVASGIAHPAPPAGYAAALGVLASLGESPIPGHPISLHPLPGQPGIYTAQRNFLVLERQNGAWRAWWDLEEDGATPALRL